MDDVDAVQAQIARNMLHQATGFRRGSMACNIWRSRR